MLPEGINLDDVQFCFDFVIEAALRLQDFDLELRSRVLRSEPPEITDDDETEGQD